MNSVFYDQLLFWNLETITLEKGPLSLFVVTEKENLSSKLTHIVDKRNSSLPKL